MPPTLSPSRLAVLLLLCSCATASETRFRLIDVYRVAEETATAEPERGEEAVAAAEAEHREASSRFGEALESSDLAQAREQARNLLEANTMRRNLAGIRAELARGNVDAALQKRHAGSYSRAGTTADHALDEEHAALGEALRAYREAHECAAKVGPLLERAEIAAARRLVFAPVEPDAPREPELVPCDAQWKVRIAELAFAESLGRPCAGLLEAANLGAQLWNAPSVDEFVRDAFARARTGCLQAIGAGTFPLEQVPALVTRMKETAATSSERVQKPLDAIAREVNGTRSEAAIVALEREGRYPEARELAFNARALDSVRRLDREHPLPVVARLRTRITSLGKEAPLAAAFLQSIARGYGDSVPVVPTATELAVLEASGPAPRRPFPTFTFGIRTTDCARELRGLIGHDRHGGPGSWLVTGASCDEKTARTETRRTVQYETRKVARQVPSGDGLTTRTAWVDAQYEVTKEQQVTLPSDEPFVVRLRISSPVSEFPTFQTAASSPSREEVDWTRMQRTIEEDLTAQFLASAEVEKRSRNAARLAQALARVEQAGTDDAREDALAEVALLSEGREPGAADHFRKRYDLPSPIPWPWLPTRFR